MFPSLKPQKIEEIHRLHAAGYSPSEIARRLSVGSNKSGCAGKIVARYLVSLGLNPCGRGKLSDSFRELLKKCSPHERAAGMAALAKRAHRREAQRR